MEALLLLALALALAAAAHRWGYDSRDLLDSKERELAARGMRWSDTGDPATSAR